MTTIHLSAGTLHVRLTLLEKISGLLRDVAVPLAAVRSVDVVPDGAAAARGLRAPGLGLPGVRLVGTWRGRGHRALVAVHGRRPAVRVRLEGERWTELLLGVDDVEEAAAALRRAAPAVGGRGESAASTTVRIASHGETLVGTFTTPAGPGPFPAALVLPGSGPVDRDSDAKQLRLGITRELSDALVPAGWATLRYDKRGVGESSGSFLATGLTDLVEDAGAALAVLREQPAVRPDQVVLVGHSEGALVAGAVAAGRTDLAGVALLSASATPGEELLRWQAAQIAPTLPAPIRLLLRALRTDMVRQVSKNHARLRATTADVARLGGRRINARWHREFMAHDPRTDLARISVPVLALTGAKDLQTPPRDVEVIAATVRGPVRTLVVDDVSHILRTQPGAPTLASYRKDVRRPVDARVLEAVTTWAEDVARG